MSTSDHNVFPATEDEKMRRFAQKHRDQLSRIAGLQAATLAETLTLFSPAELEEAIRLKLVKTFGEAMPFDRLAAQLAGDQVRTLPAYTPHGGEAVYCTTPRVAAAEQSYFDGVKRLAARGDGLPRSKIAHSLHRFAERQESRGRGSDPVMLDCLAYLLGRGQFKILSGPPGAGKSALLRAVAEAYAAYERPTFAAAPTDKAMESLATDLGVPGIRSSGLAEAIGKGTVPAGSLILFDEAGMEGTLTLSEIVTLAERHGIELILAGDHKQIPSAAAGEPMPRTIDMLQRSSDLPHPVVLDNTYRQRSAGDRAAVLSAFRGNGQESVRHFDNAGGLDFRDGEAAVLAAAAEALADAFHGGPQQQPTALMLSLGDETTERANIAARRAFEGRGRLGKSKPVRTAAMIGDSPADRILPLAAGDRIVLTGDILAEKPSGASVTLSAGSLATIRHIGGEAIEIGLDGSKSSRIIRRTDRVGRDCPLPINYGYALDVRTAQGMTTETAIFAVTAKIDGPHYLVGVSRHTDKLRMVVDRDAYGNAAALGEAASLHSAKRMIYDFEPAATP